MSVQSRVPAEPPTENEKKTCLSIGQPIDQEGTRGAAWGSWGWESSAGVPKASVHTAQAGSLSCLVSPTPSRLLRLLAFTTSGEGEKLFNGFKNESPDINLSTVFRRNSFFRTVYICWYLFRRLSKIQISGQIVQAQLENLERWRHLGISGD